ncbi:hypothetical protein FB451DRAFT_1189492 [Mycena latifolia]|nr:hypothetical protein FB451DRAFT_1189492 [Mycena latifolia]
MSKCRMRSMLHEARRARAQSLDGTPAQRVVRVKQGWCDVRASTGKRGTATHDLHHAGKCPLCETSRTATCKREPPAIRKNNDRKDRKRSHSPTSNGAAEDELMEEVALRVAEGRSSRKEHGPRQVGICEQRVLASCMLGRRDRRGKKSGGTEQAEWGYKHQGDAVSDGGKVREACAEEQRGEGRKEQRAEIEEGRRVHEERAQRWTCTRWSWGNGAQRRVRDVVTENPGGLEGLPDLFIIFERVIMATGTLLYALREFIL